MEWPQQFRPSLEITRMERDSLEFTITNADISFANALRRIMIAEVPTMAIDLVTMYENTSVLHDEYLVHRLGLVPIDSRQVDQYNYRDECECMDECPKCSIDYTLDVTCTSDETLRVTNLHILPDGDTDDIPLPARIIGPDNEEQSLVISKLRRNQTIKARLTASKGFGRMHAKWSPVATAVFQLDRKLLINRQVEDKISETEKVKLVEALGRALRLESDRFGIGKNRLVVVEDLDQSLYELYENKVSELGFKNLLKLEEDETKFHFIVESSGAIPPEQIVSMALQILDTKLRTIASLLQKDDRSAYDVASNVLMNRPLYNLD